MWSRMANSSIINDEVIFRPLPRRSPSVTDYSENIRAMNEAQAKLKQSLAGLNNHPVMTGSKEYFNGSFEGGVKTTFHWEGLVVLLVFLLIIIFVLLVILFAYNYWRKGKRQGVIHVKQLIIFQESQQQGQVGQAEAVPFVPQTADSGLWIPD